MRWTLKKRKMWYRITGKPVWYHKRCVDYSQHEGSESLFKKGKWVIGWRCPHCSMTVDSEDYFQGKKEGEMTMEKLDPNYRKFSETHLEAWQDDYMGDYYSSNTTFDMLDLDDWVPKTDDSDG